MSNDQISKPFWSLGFGNWDSVELLGQSQISNAAVNTFPGLVHTARHVMKVGNTRSRWPNPSWEGAVEGGIGDWDEVVTR